MTISDSLRERLKVPLGTLIPEAQASKRAIQSIIPEGAYVVSVGDRTTEKMITFGLVPSLQIVDNQEKRQRRRPLDAEDALSCLECKNPAAGITPQCIGAVKDAFLLEPPVRITVDGEEDLLVVPACIHAPKNSVVLYGQPDRGLVVVPVTAEIRNRARDILESIV